MKKLSLLFAAVLAFAMNAMALNPYAYAVSVAEAGDNATISYTLNAAATAVSVVAYKDGVELPAAVSYVKVTEAPADWSGEYVIASMVNDQAAVWTGVDAGQCRTFVNVADNKLADGEYITVTVAKMAEGEGYSIKVNGGANDGKYISSGTSAPTYSNGLKFIDTPTRVDFALNTDGTVAMSQTISGNADASKNGTMYLIYNKQSGENNERYRFYKSNNYNTANYLTPYLWKKTAGTTPDPEPEDNVSPYCQTEVGHLFLETPDPNSYVLLSIGSNNGKTVVRVDQDTEKNSAMFDYLLVNPMGATTGADVETGGANFIAVEFDTPTPDAEGYITLEILWSTVNWPGRWMVQNVKVKADATCEHAVLGGGTPTGFENIETEKAFKFYHNGQIFIQKGDAVYTITGVRVQ